MTKIPMLKRGPVTLRPAVDDGGKVEEMKWLAELNGHGAVGRISAEVVVPTACRGMIDVEQWDVEHVEHIAAGLDLAVSNLFEIHKLHKVELRSVDTEIPILSAALRRRA